MSNTERKRVLNYRNDNGLAPNPDNIDYGEIAIGYKKDNEAIYIKNTANGIVDFTPISIVNITYTELKKLRDNSKLKPSQYYRITDFVTTVANDTEARSASHRFDIIVMASKENKLQEECYAIQHEGDTYFANCNLAAWKIWYCLDNDTTKYAWADTTNGKGVIYRMIDEWQNDCPYDFKNIMFSRTVTAGGLNIDGVYYTFSWVNEANEVEDASIVGQTLTNDEETVNGVHDNLISASDAYHLEISNNTMAFALNGNVFVSEYTYGDGFFYGIYGNHFAINCYNNTFGNNCNNNSFGNRCSSNTFRNDCSYNSFGNSCNRNSFGYNCNSNSFGNSCNSNSFGNDCYSNSFGNDCNSNSFGNDCNSNSFGNRCTSNSFGNSCYSNSFGSNCSYNSFGNDCLNNSFGNACYSNSFGYNFQTSTLGNGVQYVKVAISETEHVKYVQILNGTQGTDSTNLLEINFVKGAKYSQFAGFTSDNVLETWVEADAPHDVVDGGSY